MKLIIFIIVHFILNWFLSSFFVFYDLLSRQYCQSTLSVIFQDFSVCSITRRGSSITLRVLWSVIYTCLYLILTDYAIICTAVHHLDIGEYLVILPYERYLNIQFIVWEVGHNRRATSLSDSAVHDSKYRLSCGRHFVSTIF